MVLIQNIENMKKVQVKNNFYFEFISKPNVDTIVITVYMWKQYDFETIYISNDVVNIHYTIGKVFGSQERSYYMDIYSYFGRRITNRPHTTSNYIPVK